MSAETTKQKYSEEDVLAAHAHYMHLYKYCRTAAQNHKVKMFRVWFNNCGDEPRVAWDVRDAEAFTTWEEYTKVREWTILDSMECVMLDKI